MADQIATTAIGWQNKFSTTLTSGITSTDTTIPLNALPTPSEGFLVIEPDSSTNWEVIYYTSKTGSAVVCTSVANGRGVDDSTAISHSQGATVRMDSTAGMFEVLKNASAITDDTINTVKIKSASEFIANHVSSGGVITADAAGSTRLASITAGVVYINGRRHTFAASTSRTYTASKDVYVDLLQSTSDNVATLVFTDNTTNAASPALAANSVRLGIVVVGATSIAASTSIGQGGYANIAPVISSQVLKGFDSLGNKIYPKGPSSPAIAQNPYMFSVYRGSDKTGIADNVLTKMDFDTKKFDTGNNFDAVTNFRFTAPVAGYYQLNVFMQFSSINSTLVASTGFVYKNGASIQTFGGLYPNVGIGNQVTSFGNWSGLVQLAAGDYIEIYGTCDVISSTINFTGTAVGCHFSGFLASAS
jgi:hypothetical protein